MTRDTRSAYRARLKATNDSVTRAVTERGELSEASYRAAKDARVAREASRVRYTRDDLINAVVVKDAYGWHKVLYMNQLTVTIDGDFGARRIPFARVLDYREATK